MKEILSQGDAMKEYMVAMRQKIHQNPEIGLEEHKTTALIKDELQSMGVEILPLGLKTGVVGRIKGREGGLTLALRGDIDALPIQEITNLPYASKNKGVMHACGHDGHTAILLGAARLLASMEKTWRGDALFIFQPAEETLFGACQVVETGVFEEYGVSMILGLHGSPFLPLGKVGFISGPSMAAADKFIVKVRGKGGHGAYPQNAHDPVVTAAQTIIGLQNIVSREMSPLESVVLSVGQIQGGDAFNIIPEEVTFTGTVRTLSKEVRETIEGRMKRIISGCALANECKSSLEYLQGVPVLYNDPQLVERVISTAKKVIEEESIIRMEEPFMGSEDFALFLEKAPGVYFHLGLKDSKKEMVMLHNEAYDFNDDALPLGASLMVAFALDYLS